MTIWGALLALLYALPDLLKLLKRLDKPEDAATILARANALMDELDKADTPEKTDALAESIAHFWANRK